jgi:hypothetical protein
MALPKRPTPGKAAKTQVVRLRTAIKENRRVKKEYAVARGKNLLGVLRESARSDLAALEVGAIELLHKVGALGDATLDERAEELEAANLEAGIQEHEGGGGDDAWDM